MHNNNNVDELPLISTFPTDISQRRFRYGLCLPIRAAPFLLGRGGCAAVSPLRVDGVLAQAALRGRREPRVGRAVYSSLAL